MALRLVPRDRHFDYIDGLRGVAVLAVVLFDAFQNVRGPSFAPHVFYNGTRGVDLFFVLSGFCLSLRAVSFSSIDDAAPHPGRFVISRLARVAPPYYVALALFAVLSFTQFGLPTAATSASAAHSALPELIHDAFFATSESPKYNASFWTLGLEMRWYLLYPLLFAVFLRSKVWFACIGLGAYAWYATPLRVVDAGTLPCFMLGIVAASLAAGSGPRPAREIVFPVAAVVLLFALAKQSSSVVADHGDALWHVACFLLVLAGGYGVVRRLLCATPLRAVGVASYSIYLVHQPFLAWAIAHGAPTPIAAIGCIGIGFLFWFAIERVVAKSWRSRIEAWALKTLPSREKQTPKIFVRSAIRSSP